MKYLFLLPLVLLITACGSTGGGSGGDSVPKIEWPESKGNVKVNDPKTVSGTYDGGMKTHDGAGLSGNCGQGENMEPMFILRSGAKLRNAIIKEAPDGIHVEGNNVLIENVYFLDVCEDAITLGTGNPQNVTIRNCTFAKAEDKVIQINDGNKITIEGCRFDVFKSATRWKKPYGGTATLKGNMASNGQGFAVLDEGAKKPKLENNKLYNVQYEVRE